ncbi:hypothetical protein AFFFEF_02164 [Methylorubrum extorquens]
MRLLIIDSFAGGGFTGLSQWTVADTGTRPASAVPNAGAARRRTDIRRSSVRTVSAKKRSPVSAIMSTKRFGMPRTLKTDSSAPKAVRFVTRHQMVLPTRGNIRLISSLCWKLSFLVSIAVARDSKDLSRVGRQRYNRFLLCSIKFEQSSADVCAERRPAGLQLFSNASAAATIGATTEGQGRLTRGRAGKRLSPCEFASLFGDTFFPIAGSVPNGFLLTGHETKAHGEVRIASPRTSRFHDHGLDFSVRFRFRQGELSSGTGGVGLCRPRFHDELGRRGNPASLSAGSMGGVFADNSYWSKSSSANHSSAGSEAPSRSTTTCLKFASADLPCIGISIASPTARTTPRSFTAPRVIVTGAPSCTGLVSSLRSATGSLSYRPRNGAVEHSFLIAATFPGAVIHTLSLPPSAGLAQGSGA